MSNQVLRITLDDDDPLISGKELGQIVVNADAGTVDYVDTDGNPEHIAVFDASGSSTIYMEKAVYDKNVANNGVVDDSERLGGILSNQYATKAWVIGNATGDMTKADYATNGAPGMVDNSLRLNNQPASYYASTTWVQANFGDMRKTTYDTNDSGIVDNSERLGGQIPSYYLNYSNFINQPNLLDWADCNEGIKLAGDIITWDGSDWINTSTLDLGTF